MYKTYVNYDYTCDYIMMQKLKTCTNPEPAALHGHAAAD